VLSGGVPIGHSSANKDCAIALRDWLVAIGRDGGLNRSGAPTIFRSVRMPRKGPDGKVA